ncbi:hypothetical protein MKW92_020510 [Papaver armeniacum]|nr:hypothetical protein MKW92_020510 [Papaver armeniacum]
MNMITGYVRNGEIESARELFDGMNENLQVAYNAMISGYVQHGFMLKVLEMFKSMHLEVVVQIMDSFLLVSKSMVLFSRTGWRPASKLCTTCEQCLVTLYCKCGKFDQARQIFDSMLRRTMSRGNAILSGYVSVDELMDLLTWMVMISDLHRMGMEKMRSGCSDRMRTEGLAPCDYSSRTLEHGRQLHAQLIQLGFNSSLSAGNALITMYARCGVVEAASCSISYDALH